MARATGMVLGKFMPPHAGHVYLVDFARAFCSTFGAVAEPPTVTVVVGTLASEPIPGALRYAWMRELFGDLNVVHLTDDNPQTPEEHPRFWDIWRESLLRVLPERPDYVFASEAYGERLAAELGAEWIAVDVAREIVPVSATAIRANPLANWQHIPRCVRPHFVKRVCIAGPESTGKTTLASRLAAHFRSVWVPEYARSLLEPRGGKVEPSDMPRIARGQIASEEARARDADRVLFCDTDALATKLWSEMLFEACAPEVAAAADAHAHDLVLLTAPDVPFVPDVVRYRPQERAAFFERLRAELERRGRRFVVLEGDWEARFARAVREVETLLR